MVVQKEPSPRPGTREFAANDLQKLMGRSQEEFKVEEDMPPLLQVRKSRMFYQINPIALRMAKTLEFWPL